MQAWDQYTILNEPVSSIELMERAAKKCADWIRSHYSTEKKIQVFCGNGNNGGDGLAIARMLLDVGYSVSVFTVGKSIGSEDYQTNLQRFQAISKNISGVASTKDFHSITHNDIIVDALFGTGINKPLEGLFAELVRHINQCEPTVISIDLPSGLIPDGPSGDIVIKATHTLTFQAYKKALLVQDNAAYTGEVHVLDIGLHAAYLKENRQENFLVTRNLVRSIYKPRNRFAHKGQFGHALMVAGSYGKMGAALLAARACIRSGTGLLTCYIPRCGYNIMQSGIPEAMVITDSEENHLTQLPAGIENYDAIAIGPGIGTSDATQKLLSFLTRRYQKPLVIDADGLNCLALQNALIQQLPQHSILTPHVKEFDRLLGPHDSDFERIETAIQKAMEWQIVILLKGHHTCIATPGGQAYYNNTGNAGMARGGSGDMLTGIITAFVAQGYDTWQAALMGTYLHGLAGDYAAAKFSQEAMTPSLMIDCLPDAFKSLQEIS